MSEQTYTITEAQRIDVLDLLDLVEWALMEHHARGIKMPEDHERWARTWDALAAMAPDECDFGAGAASSF